MGLPEGNAFLDQLLAAYRAGRGDDPDAEGEELVGRVRALYACVARGDLAALGPLMAEDVELEIRAPSVPDFDGLWRGRDDVLAAIERNFARVGDQAPEVHEVAVRDGTVTVLARESGHLLPDGTPYTVSWLQFFTFRDGLLARVLEATT